jgi:hypothetical protein
MFVCVEKEGRTNKRKRPSSFVNITQNHFRVVQVNAVEAGKRNKIQFPTVAK